MGFGRGGLPCARTRRTSAIISSQGGSICSVAGTNKASASPPRSTRKRCPRFTRSRKAPVCSCNSLEVIEVTLPIDTNCVSPSTSSRSSVSGGQLYPLGQRRASRSLATSSASDRFRLRTACTAPGPLGRWGLERHGGSSTALTRLDPHSVVDHCVFLTSLNRTTTSKAPSQRHPVAFRGKSGLCIS